MSYEREKAPVVWTIFRCFSTCLTKQELVHREDVPMYNLFTPIFEIMRMFTKILSGLYRTPLRFWVRDRSRGLFSAAMGVLQMRTSALFGAKTYFSKFMVCPHGQGGGGLFYPILCGRPLWTTPYPFLLAFFHVHGPDRFWRYCGPVAKSRLFPGCLLYTADHCFYTICGVAIHTVNSLKIYVDFATGPSDIKIGPAHAH